MSKVRVLFVSQEINPFLPESVLSHIGRHLPQGIHEKGKEIRVFMPRFGKINERRDQLHEVIRLSGMNLIINDGDHPLIIKVASIPTARMQVYFIDNEEYFHRKAVLHDDNGKFFEDNDERSIFFVKGVLETVKKLGWAPDIIHCHGWMSSLMPLYIKKLYNQDPHFSDAKVIYSMYDQDYQTIDKTVGKKMVFDGLEEEHLGHLKNPTLSAMHKMAITHSDGVIDASGNIDTEVASYISDNDKPLLTHDIDENFVNVIDQFYEEVLEGKSILVEE
jgi:starch synthase